MARPNFTPDHAVHLVVGSLVKLAGIKTPLLVTSVPSRSVYVVSGPRGDFAIADCGTHWLRGSTRRGSLPREIRIEWTRAPLASVEAA